MKRLLVTTGIVIAAAVPAALGLVGNASFGQSVPVTVPARATLLDDHGGQIPPRTTDDSSTAQITISTPASSTQLPSTHDQGDDRGGRDGSETAGTSRSDEDAATAPGTSSAEPGDDHGGQRSGSEAEPGGDHGGLRSSTAAVPGDDHGGLPAAQAQPGDDHGGASAGGSGQSGGSGTGRSGSHDDGSGHRGGNDGADH